MLRCCRLERCSCRTPPTLSPHRITPACYSLLSFALPRASSNNNNTNTTTTTTTTTTNNNNNNNNNNNDNSNNSKVIIKGGPSFYGCISGVDPKDVGPRAVGLQTLSKGFTSFSRTLFSREVLNTHLFLAQRADPP